VRGQEGKPDATLITIGVPGTREQAVARLSADELRNDMDVAMNNVSSITFYGVTGEAYVRNAQFDAITASMNRSLVIAVVACLVLLFIIFRSLRYTLITLVPVLLVACWLYGFMYVVGYHLNMMTATIAAISIGVGIDFSIHFTVRFRQEFEKSGNKRTALHDTSRNTGMALFGTAVSTALGFAVIIFAPMPMFSAFGLLTAVMIALSFLMAIFALPSLLLLFATIKTGKKSEHRLQT
jgi:predicted RND superfamily exporter protein